jgi:FtsP/CotA-like multicopper oxidase with cupredoxin domain
MKKLSPGNLLKPKPRRRHVKNSCCFLLALIQTSIATTTSATIITLGAAKDSTLYQPASGGTTNSNGAGEHCFAGRTDDGYVRRGLIAFNLTDVPPGSIISAATLTLYMSRTRDTANNVLLHRLLGNWGEGASNAGQEEGRGIQALPGDATWYHRFYPTSSWASAGGDFVASASATAAVNKEGFYSWSSPGLVADVQGWLNNPGSNFGWVIKGDESNIKTSKRFDTREVETVSQRPTLTLEFVAPAQFGACVLSNGSCSQLTSNDCFIVGGMFLGIGSNCPTPTGACCLANGNCTNATTVQCVALGGVYQGDNTTCASNPCPILLAPFVDPLPIPGPLQPVTGTTGGEAYYEVTMQQVQQKLHRDLPPTTVWAYGTAFPGPVIEASVGKPVSVKWINDLRDANGQLRTNHYLPVDTCLHGPDMAGASPRTVVHLHGGKVMQKDDGHPEDTFLPGQSRTNYYENDQPAAGIWFHDHALGITRLNVYMGLAGLYLLRDDVENALGLPAGPHEIPLVIQDRKFHSDGSLSYPAVWDEHFFGDTILVNGKVWPYLVVKQGKYRFRMVNGSTSRTYTLTLSSGAVFHQIGTDAGLLPELVPLTELTFMPGERADVVMDFAAYSSGEEIFLTNSAPAPFPGPPGVGVIPNIIKFIVTNAVGHTAPLPATLRPLERLYETNSVNHRNIVLRKSADSCTGAKWLINDLGWNDITEYPILGTAEVWNFINRSGVAHPMHLHLVLMQILDRQPFIFTNNMVVPTGPRVPPSANEAGWKDTVRASPNEITRIITRFDGFIGRYPYHCHILEHEDHEMMRQFQVLPPPVVTSIQLLGSNVSLTFTTTSNRFHALERTTNLLSGSWNTITNNILGDGSSMTIGDTQAADSSQQFYRIRLAP